MRIVFLANLAYVTASKISSLPIAIVNKMMVTNQVYIGGKNFTFVIDANSADTFVPICDENKSDSACFDPHESSTFRNCVSTSSCVDRQAPPFSCTHLSPLWDQRSAVLTEHILRLGGTDVSVKSFEFVESRALIGNAPAIERAPLKGVLNFQKAILGIGPLRRSCRNETLVSSSNAQYIAFESQSLSLHESVPSGVVLAEAIQQKEANSSVLQGKYSFNVFHPTLCGTDLLGTASSHWAAIIDTSIECLVLPSFMFEGVTTWKAGSDGFLHFFLDSLAEEHSIAINLDKVCLEAADSSLPNTAERPIILGSAVLTSVGGIGLELNGLNRVGFSAFSTPNSKCSTAVPACVGNQRYDALSNTCTQPECPAYFLSVYNASLGVCELSPLVTPFINAFIFLVLIGEVFVYYLRKRSVSLAQSACERNQVT